MIVGLVVTGFDKGGLEQVVYNLYLGYKANNIPTYILCEKPEFMGYFASQLSDVRDFCIYNGNIEVFIGYCYRRRITHLHYHYNTSFIELARQCGIHTVYTIHNIYTWLSDKEIIAYGKHVKKCDAIVAVSSFVKEYFCKRCEIRPDYVEVIANGVNTAELLRSYKLPRAFTRIGMGLANSDLIFAQFASFTPVKHQIGLIGVFERICAMDSRVKLLLIGDILDEQYYKDFIHIWKKSPARDSIKIVPFIEHHYVGEFLRTVVDVSILATLQEGCSNAVLESAVCGKPLLITDVGNAQDIKNESVAIVHRAYESIYSLNNAGIQRLSHQKETINTDEIVEKAIKIINNIKEYKQNASRSLDQIQMLDIENMVNSYVLLLKGIK